MTLAIAVDTSVLLDIAIPGAAHQEPSRRRLESAMARGALWVCEAVYAELASQFVERSVLDGFLADLGIRLAPSTAETLETAGRAHREYLRRRPRGRCPSCGVRLPGRERVQADFLIGGHAVCQSGGLLTRDRGFFRSYFRRLVLVP